MMERYLHEFEQALRLSPEQTRTIVAEVRANLEDLVAHLQAQGYTREEAEEEAVRRFDDAGGLARAMRRAYRRAPLPLQAAAVALVALGLSGLALVAVMVQALAAAAAHPEVGLRLPALDPGQPDFLPSIPRLLINLSPQIGIAACAAISLWLATRVLLHPRRRGWRRTGAGVATVAGLDALVLVLLWGTFPTAAHHPAPDPFVPDPARLAAVGLVGRPAPGQPARPATVDHVYADTTATYVQYRIPDAPHDGQPFPQLSDDAGHPYTMTEGGSSVMPFLQLLPWRPAVVAYATFGPLRSAAHAAVLTFYERGRLVETVRVPLNLAALRQAGGVSHPHAVAALHGITLTLTAVTRGLTVSQLTYTTTVAPGIGPVTTAGIQAVLDPHGRNLASLLDATGSCGQPSGRPFSCTNTIGFATPPRGTPLVLAISRVQYLGVKVGSVIRGPWRLPFVMP